MVQLDRDEVEFQAFSWSVDDGIPAKNAKNSQFVTYEQNDYAAMNFTVHVFGKNREGESVAAHVTGYHPTFCVKFDESVSDYGNYDALKEVLRTLLVDWDNSAGDWTRRAEYGDHLLDIPDGIIYKKDCWGFNFNRNVPFFKFSFKSTQAYNKAISYFKMCQKNTMTEEEMETFCDELSSMVDDQGKPIGHQQDAYMDDISMRNDVPKKALKFVKKLAANHLSLLFAKGKLFEVIDPILRFAHMKNLKMAGWMRARRSPKLRGKGSLTSCAIEVHTTYDDLQPIQCDDINPFLKEMSFDIEAYSHNDLFPDPTDPRNYCYQIGITLKQYADKSFDRLLLHCRTPAQLRGASSGLCQDMEDIPTCLRSMKPVEQCDKKECLEKGHELHAVSTRVENFETEKDLLMRFSEIIVSEDPDMIYHYNGDIFDWNYLMTRAQVVMMGDNGSLNTFRRMSRMKSYLCEAKEAKFASSAYGDNKYMRVDIPGRLNIDLMVWIQRNMPADRYPSYSLDSVAEKEIQEVKRDVDAKDIFQAFRSGDPVQLTVIGDYCCQDTVLVQKLVNKLDVVTQMFEMANITDTPPMYLLQKGQQIKCFSQLSKEAMDKGFLIPLAEEREDGKFKGAIVLNPITGKYDTPTSVLDFSSLYPSIQVAYTVCYTTIVLDQTLHKKIMDLKAQGLPLEVNGVKFDVIEWDEDTYVYQDRAIGTRLEFMSMDDAKKMGYTEKQILHMIDSGQRHDSAISWSMGKKYYAYAFAQKVPSIIPELQVKLKQSRKAVRALMAPIEHSKNPDDQLRYRVLNGRQLAIKVSMNSLYGFTSAFMMNLQALSASVTAKGRQMIEQSKYFMEHAFEKIARNEVWTKEDVLTCFAKDGKEIVAREEGDEWIFEFRGAELARTKIGEIPEGWCKKYPTAVEGKPWSDHDLSIRVVAGDSVTEDTPVLCRDSKGTMLWRTFKNLGQGPWQTRIDGKEYQQCDLSVWSDHGFTPVRHIVRHKTNKKMFRVNTYSGTVDCTADHSLLNQNAEKVSPKDVKVGQLLLHADLPTRLCAQPVTFDEEYAWALGLFYFCGSCDSDDGWILTGNDVTLERARSALNQYDRVKFKILKPLGSSKECRMVVHSTAKDFHDKFRRWFYDEGDKFKKVPDCILNAKHSIRLAFYKAGHRENAKPLQFPYKSKISAASAYHLLIGLDHKVTIGTLTDDPNLYLLKFHETDAPLDQIRQIIELPQTEQYVYDIETESHHFQAGPGRMILHNTDSVFANYPQSTLAEAISLSHKAAELLTEKIFNRKPIELVYEKTIIPLYIQKKKNYIGVMYELDDKRFKLLYKGIAIKRRNYCDFVKEVFWGAIYPALGLEQFEKPDGKKDLRKATWDLSRAAEKSLEALETALMKLVTEEVPMEDFLISASLKSTYKGPTCDQCNGRGKNGHICKDHPKDRECQKCMCSTCAGRGVIVNLPHVQLVKRMKERDLGSAPISGQRFSYIVVCDHLRSDDLSARTENLAFAKKHGLKPDPIFYLDQQIRKPLTKFLTLLDKAEETERVFSKIQNALFEKAKKERAMIELEARRQFFNLNQNGKRPAAIAPLKAPKKPTVSKEEKQKRATKDIKPITTFFSKAE